MLASVEFDDDVTEILTCEDCATTGDEWTIEYYDDPHGRIMAGYYCDDCAPRCYCRECDPDRYDYSR